MLNITAFPGRYIQGDGAIDRLGEFVSQFGQKGLALCDPFVVDNILGDFADRVNESAEIVWERFDGECCDEEIGRLVNLISKFACDVVIGMGGGKTLDTAKAVADQVGLPIIIVPTAASSDAPCSAGAVIYNLDGSFNRVVHPIRNPDVVLVDTRIIVNAPVRLLVAGMGDALATWFEAESVQSSYSPNVLGGRGSLAAYNLSRLCFDILMENGVLAKMACEAKLISSAFEQVVEANILLSGLGFESGGLATAHSVYNGLTILPATKQYLHGEKVAFGVLVSLFLTGKSLRLIKKVYGFCQDIGLPICLDDIGLGKVTRKELEEVAQTIVQEGTNIHHEPMAINYQNVLEAIIMADKYGRTLI